MRGDRYIKETKAKGKDIDGARLPLWLGNLPQRKKKDYTGIISGIILAGILVLGVRYIVSTTIAKNKKDIARFEKNLRWQEEKEAELQRFLNNK